MSYYKRSLDLGAGSVGGGDDDMPVQPSKAIRKNSFKKIGEMILESQNSGRK
jgi:hypothetical protein